MRTKKKKGTKRACSRIHDTETIYFQSKTAAERAVSLLSAKGFEAAARKETGGNAPAVSRWYINIHERK